MLALINKYDDIVAVTQCIEINKLIHNYHTDYLFTSMHYITANISSYYKYQH